MKATYSVRPQNIEEISRGQFYVNMDIKEVFKRGTTLYECEQVRTDGRPQYGMVVEALIREKYSVSDELALHRQKEQKAEAFAEYNTFCEHCKDLARPVFFPEEEGGE